MTLPQRKPNRLKQYDYSSHGAYFVTICTESRKNTLCNTVGDGLPVPKRPGEVAAHYILEISNHFPNAHIDHYVVMPNHIHLLLFLQNSGTGDPSPTQDTRCRDSGIGCLFQIYRMIVNRLPTPSQL